MYEKNKRRKRFFQVASCILFVVLVSLFGIIMKQQQVLGVKETELKVKDSIIHQYKNECIIFAGGGTVQQYLINDTLNNIGVKIDVKNYQDYPSKYIHLPSKDAWALLWDDVNEGKNRQYCPIILSATEIDTKDANINRFKKNRKIVEYNVDSIPLMVQIIDHKKNNNPITLDYLKKMLQDSTNKYEIWTTTENSGTYTEYKRLLNGINLDSIVKNQSGGRKDFKPTEGDKEDSTKTQLFLANNSYYYTRDAEYTSKRIVISDTKPQKISLFIYTIAVKNDGAFEIPSQAKNSLNTSVVIQIKKLQIIQLLIN